MKDEILMKRRILNIVFGVCLTLLLVPKIAHAENHLTEAIIQTREAIEHGKSDNSVLLVKHVKEGINHAQAADKEKANPHNKEGIRHLMAALDEGMKKNSKAATAHAEEALTHLEAAAK